MGRHSYYPEEPEEDQRPIAKDDDILRHAEKQDCSWRDAWRYFEIHGYDMSHASPQYD